MRGGGGAFRERLEGRKVNCKKPLDQAVFALIRLRPVARAVHDNQAHAKFMGALEEMPLAPVAAEHDQKASAGAGLDREGACAHSRSLFKMPAFDKAAATFAEISIGP